MYYRENYKILVAIVTIKSKSKNLINIINNIKGKKIQGICILDQDLRGNYIDNVLVKSYISDLIKWIQLEAVDEVVIDIPYNIYEKIEDTIKDIKSMGVTIYLNIDEIDKFNKYYKENKKVIQFGENTVVTISLSNQNKIVDGLRRLIDIIGSIVGLIISVPIIAVIAIPLKLESEGPLFFKQERVGKNGKIFIIYKLRSMYNDAEQKKQALMKQNEMKGLMFKIKDDPRITKVGKFIRKTSIDELPQFWNVLKGDMSLVGTRPPTLDEYQNYKPYHKRRLSIKPGITGIWQISGRNDIEDFEDVVKMDLKYIDEWSLGMEFKILLKTIVIVLNLKGAR